MPSTREPNSVCEFRAWETHQTHTSESLCHTWRRVMTAAVNSAVCSQAWGDLLPTSFSLGCFVSLSHTRVQDRNRRTHSHLDTQICDRAAGVLAHAVSIQLFLCFLKYIYIIPHLLLNTLVTELSPLSFVYSWGLHWLWWRLWHPDGGVFNSQSSISVQPNSNLSIQQWDSIIHWRRTFTPAKYFTV